MSEPGGWNAPDGWGGPTQPPPPPYGQPEQPAGSPSYGSSAPAGSLPPPYGSQPPPYGSTPPPYGSQPPPWGYRPPEVKPGVVPLRPLGLGELLDGAVSVVRRYPRPTLGFAALVSLVTTLLNVLLMLTAFEPFFSLDTAALEQGDTAALEDAIGGAAIGAALSVVLALLSGAVLTGVLTAVVGKAVLGEPVSFGEVLREVRPLLLRLVGLALLVLLIVYGVLFVAIAVGAVLVAIAGPVMLLIALPLWLAGAAAAVYAYVRLALAPCVLVLERARIGASMRRSGTLVKGDWWRVFGILLLTAVIGGFVSQIIQIPFAVLGAGPPTALFDPEADVLATRSLIVSSIGAAIAAALVTPFTAAVRALLYVDRRMRAEGLDVALTAASSARP